MLRTVAVFEVFGWLLNYRLPFKAFPFGEGGTAKP